jgi:hypothetical protein
MHQVFHQLDAARVFTPEETAGSDPVKLAEDDMKTVCHAITARHQMLDVRC